MQFRTLGSRTGIKISVLGFGCMRLPRLKPGEPAINHEEAIRLIRKGIDSGINYVDTAYGYHRGESEIVLGKALKDGYREKVTLVTKCPMGRVNEPKDFEKLLDEQLKKLDVDYLDVYLFHGLSLKGYQEKVLGMDIIERAKAAREAGKIKHLGFSSHEKPEGIKTMIDSGFFDVMLVQYNILDTVNEEVINRAGEKGMGVVIMGPVGGGRLAIEPSEEMNQWLTEGRTNFVDLALKFVWTNPNVSVALSGMGSDQMVDENLTLASNEKYTLTEEEKERVQKIAQRYKELSDVICTQCEYCMPCPNEVNIPVVLTQLIQWQLFKWEVAQFRYRNIGIFERFPGKDGSGCEECGECEPKCPQNVPIIELLKKAHKFLSKEEA